MRTQAIICVTEIIFALILVALEWPIAKGEDYIWGLIISFCYLTLIIISTVTRILVPAMRIACGLNKSEEKNTNNLFIRHLAWILWAFVVACLFSNSIGLISCLPIIIPNCVYFIVKKDQEIPGPF